MSGLNGGKPLIRVVSGGAPAPFALPATLPEGQRYTTIRDFAASLWNKRLTEADARLLIHDRVMPLCQPPLTEAEFNGRFNSAWQSLPRAFPEGPQTVTEEERAKRRVSGLIGSQAPGHQTTTSASLGDLADYDITPPITPLAGILHPDELTIPYGTGGSGKGTLACGIICDLIHTYGLRVAIFDYEGHQREWIARIKTLYRHRYLADLPYNQVRYIAPNGPHSGLRIGSFLQHADDLRIACETWGVQYVVLDSVAGGATLGMDPKDDQTATMFATAWQRLALPMMALSHIPKNSPTTDYPYGSAYWHNLARATWFMEQTGRTQHGYVARLTNRKFNDADRQPTLMVEVQYTVDGWLESVDIGPDLGLGRSFASSVSMSGIAVSILDEEQRPMTAQEIVDDWPSGADAPDADNLRRRLNELVLAGTISKRAGGKGRASVTTYLAGPAIEGASEAPEQG